MPTVTLDRDHLYERLGKTYTQEEFELLCFEFGVELDDVTSAYQRAKDMNKNLTAKELEKYDQSVEYAIDVPANRYDLLCMEGMARALRIFLLNVPNLAMRHSPELLVSLITLSNVRSTISLIVALESLLSICPDSTIVSTISFLPLLIRFSSLRWLFQLIPTYIS